jgi:AcrR family transcriptional regulator
MRSTLSREEIREAILDAATRLVERFGYRKTTMDDLAREAGVGKGTLYLYFESKEDVVLSVGDRTNARLVERLREIARSEASAAERIREILRTRILYRFDRMAGLQQNAGEMYRDLWPTLAPRRDCYDAAEAAVIEDVIRDGVARGEMTCPDPAGWALALVWGTNSQLPYSLAPQQMRDRRAVEKRVDAVAQVMIAGLKAARNVSDVS